MSDFFRLFLAVLCMVLSLISTVIWLCLVFNILKAINASELTWFLYYTYMPISLFLAVLIQSISGKTQK